MSEWKKVKLEDILQVKKGDYITKKEAREGIYPVILGGKEPAYFIDKYNHTGKAIVISRSGASAGYVSFWNEPIFVTDGFLIEPKGGMTYEFLYYALKSKQAILHKAQKGAAIPHVTPLLIGNIDFLLPNKDVQHRIATILSRYDSLIENYQKQIKLLEEAAQRLYKEWFVDLHFPGHENTKIVDGVPEGWDKKTIDDVTCKVTTGLNPRKNFVLGKGSNYYVTIKNMADNTLFLDDRCDRVDNEALEKINKRSDLKIGDILFSGIGTIGRVALVDIPTNNWNVSESVFTLRVNDIVTKEFLYLMLLSPDMQNYCQSNAHGAAQKGIRMADLKAYSFNLPPFGVIQKFTNLVTPTIKKVSSIRNQIRLLTEARDRLLPKLMSGEIKA